MVAGRHRWVALLACATVVVLSSCSGGQTATSSVQSPPADAVVVASFNFPESTLLAEIYAQALEGAGVHVRRELDLGPRELVLPALQQGQVDVVPEYLGSALTAMAPDAARTTTDPAAALAALRVAFRGWGLRVLDPAEAQDQNGLAVTFDTASRYALRKVSDLRGTASQLTLGGPFECAVRAFCVPGLERVYGVRFARFLPFDGEDQRVSALLDGVVDVAVMFTTDGHLADGNLVLLVDDRRLQPAESVVPVVSNRVIARYGDRVTRTLDAVSAKLTSRNLVLLNWRVSVAHRQPAAEAAGWLRRQGIVPRPVG